MDASQIEDEDSLKAWLETQTQEVAIAIAHRSAMRVLPALREQSSISQSRFDLTVLVVIRANLLSAVAAIGKKDKVAAACASVAGIAENTGFYSAAFVLKASAGAAYVAITPPHDVAGDAVTAVAFAVDALADAFGGVVVLASNDNSYTEFWSALRADALIALHGARHAQETPLWAGYDNALFGAWKQLRSRWAATNDPGWRFWIDWYDAALDGSPLLGDWDRHWALLTDIALIENEVWDTGPDEVNKEVDDFYLKHKVRRQAEDLLAENARLRALILQTPHAPRDHNNPPEILELDHQRYSEVCDAASVAQDAVREIATETRKETPNLEQLEISASKLSEAVNTVLRYLGAKLDLAIDTLIKWGVPTGMVWVFANPDRISLLLSDVRTLVGAALP